MIFYFLPCGPVGSQIPDQGLNWHPLHWKLRVLATGPLGKSLRVFWECRANSENHSCGSSRESLRVFLQAAISISSFLECKISSTWCVTTVLSVCREACVFQIIDLSCLPTKKKSDSVRFLKLHFTEKEPCICFKFSGYYIFNFLLLCNCVFSLSFLYFPSSSHQRLC